VYPGVCSPVFPVDLLAVIGVCATRGARATWADGYVESDSRIPLTRSGRGLGTIAGQSRDPRRSPLDITGDTHRGILSEWCVCTVVSIECLRTQFSRHHSIDGRAYARGSYERAHACPLAIPRGPRSAIEIVPTTAAVDLTPRERSSHQETECRT
jgi:hypothetical protein